MKTETDRRGFGGKVSATRVCVPWRFALFSRVLRCARTGYAREGSSSFFPPAHYRRARFGWVFRVQDGVWYMKWWRRRCEVGIRKPGHRLSRPPSLCFAKLLFQPTIQLRTENPSRGNVSGIQAQGIKEDQEVKKHEGQGNYSLRYRATMDADAAAARCTLLK